MPGGDTGSNTASTVGTTVPLPATFDSEDNWIVYSAKMEQFFIAYGITDDNRKRAIVLTALTEDTFDILNDLCFPDEPGTKSYKEICDIMKIRFSPVVSVYHERLRFYEAKQESSETIVQFVSRIKKLSRHCSFGTYLKEVLRDKFVCGDKNASH